MVLPSISVNRKASVPVGSVATIPGALGRPSASASWAISASGLRVARGLEEALQPGAAEVAAPHGRLGQDLDRARLGRQVAGLVALDRRAGHADLRAQLILDRGRGLALVGGDAVDRAFEQAAKGFIAITHMLFSKVLGLYA